MKNKGIRFVISCTIKTSPFLFLSMLLAIAGAVTAGILPPLVLGRLIDGLAEQRRPAFSMILLYVGLLAAASLSDMAKESLITVFGQRVTRRLRHEMCAKLTRLPASYIADHESGVIASRFVSDVDTVEALFTSGVISMAADGCKVVSILAVIFTRSRGLGILMLLITPFLFWMTRVFQKRMLKAQLAHRAAVGKMNHHIPETMKNIRTIHTLKKEKYMEKRYQRLIWEGYRAMERSNFYDAVYSPIILVVSAIVVAILMILSSGNGAMQQFFGMSVGTAVAVMAYVGKVFDPLESIGMEIQNIQSAVAGIVRINEFLGEPERSLPDEKRIEIKKDCPAAELCSVTFGYEKDRKILTQYSLCVRGGEQVTLTGRTGVGKSTVFKLLLGLYRPQEGRVKIYGTEADRIPDIQKREIFGYVEQSFHRIPGTVRDQITLKDETISEEAVRRAVEMTGLCEVVESLEKGIDTVFMPELFSQGQVQLLSIARAVVSDPDILLLDEITANLDSGTEKKVMEALQKASKNRTVIAVSHRLYESKGTIYSF